MVDERRTELTQLITGQLLRRYSTATVLFHHAVAERLGLGPTDHKCLDLLLERGPLTGSQLAAITGLTTGAITGVVARLERAGYVQRKPDPDDGRKQLLIPAPERLAEVAEIFASALPRPDSVLDGFDTDQLAVIAEFLTRAADYSRDRAATLRAEVLSAGGRTPRASTT